MERTDELLLRAVERFEDRLPVLAEEITDRVRDEVPELRNLDAPEIWELHRNITIGSRRAHARYLKGGRTLPRTCPEPELEAVRLAVHSGTSLAGLLHGYRISHETSLNGWLLAVEALDDRDGVKALAIAALVRFTGTYNDRLVGQIEAAYATEQELARGREDFARLRAFHDLLEGGADDGQAIGYPTHLQHIAVVGRGVEPERVVREVSRRLNSRIASVGAPGGILLAWLGSDSLVGSDYRSSFKEAIAGADASLAIGRPWPGIGGLRRSHWEAGAAHVVAHGREDPLTFYDDFAIEAYTLQVPRRAREYVASELHGIAGDDRASQILRETLLTYYRLGHNQASAAAALRVHPETVKRRLATIERTTGHDVNRRRLEFELALRLRPLLPAVQREPSRESAMQLTA